MTEQELAAEPLRDLPHAAEVLRVAERQSAGESRRLVETVVRLQPKARLKFGEGTWWFTRRALEQATAWQVANLKASWFGPAPVLDLCCGIGGDLMQLARRGLVVGVDSDPLVAAMARANLRAASPQVKADVRCDDALHVTIPSGYSLHIDPDRRPGDRRTTRADDFLPPWPDLMRLVRQARSAVVKLAPATSLDIASLEDAHRCWIGMSGSVREQSLLCGEAVSVAELPARGRSAVWLRDASPPVWFVAPDDHCSPVEPADGVQTYLVDPNPAIRAAGLTEAFASRHGCRALSGPAGFLTTAADDPAAIAELKSLGVAQRVIWIGRCDDRKMRRELRRLDAYPVAVKTRGMKVEPARLQTRYRHCGERPVTLWLGRLGNVRRGPHTFAAATVEESSGGEKVSGTFNRNGPPGASWRGKGVRYL